LGVNGNVVTFVVGLVGETLSAAKLQVQVFDANARQNYINAIAAILGVQPSAVAITNAVATQNVGNGQPGILVTTQVTMPSAAAAQQAVAALQQSVANNGGKLAGTTYTVGQVTATTPTTPITPVAPTPTAPTAPTTPTTNMFPTTVVIFLPGYTQATFTSDLQNLLKQAVANALGLPLSSVTIVSVTNGSQNKTFTIEATSGVFVTMQVNAASQADANSAATRLQAAAAANGGKLGTFQVGTINNNPAPSSAAWSRPTLLGAFVALLAALLL
jgi:hypothetical protein